MASGPTAAPLKREDAVACKLQSVAPCMPPSTMFEKNAPVRPSSKQDSATAFKLLASYMTREICDLTTYA